ncbi:hypothetical protein [Halococcus saccharolyticus]|uniref:Uncharacterized protein n=1 Tax=Halococcus saccharolyticus DSM 5350 TaxID=1227455 RepID=M0MDE3_9EURY|nr:hypothetical protein [Halococcus saccharolyticus]EMA42679.1 hypothetical protein C449_16093 [Halococcus saccharolyticus DSM 5350]
MSEVLVDAEKLDQLIDRVEDLEDRVEELEGGSDGSEQSVDGRFDSRNASVLDSLAGREGQVFHVRSLTEIYREHTDIRRKDTLKRRVKDLVKSPAFKHDRGSRHRFVGSGGDE